MGQARSPAPGANRLDTAAVAGTDPAHAPDRDHAPATGPAASSVRETGKTEYPAGPGKPMNGATESARMLKPHTWGR